MKSPFGSNSFDKLANAGNVAAPNDESEAIKAKLDERIIQLRKLEAYMVRVESATAELYTLPSDKCLKKISNILKAVKAVALSKGLPTGTKRPLTACVNELISLREGVYTGSATDKKALTAIYATKAKQEIQELINIANTRRDRILAESSNAEHLEDFYKQAGDIIQKNADKGEALAKAIYHKSFAICRSPIVPAGKQVSLERLRNLGIKCENLGGYPVLENQMMIGINNKIDPKKDFEKPDADALKKVFKKQTLTKEETFKEADRVRKLIMKQNSIKLIFVSEKPIGKAGASWFWTMTEKDANALAKAFPGGQLKVEMFGFAFN